MEVERVYEKIIVNDFALWMVERIVEDIPGIEQSEDVAIECKGIAELKFSLN